MTLTEIRQSKRDVLLLKDIAPVLGLNPQTLRSQAQADPSKLGFPVTVAGSRTLYRVSLSSNTWTASCRKAAPKSL